MEKYKKIYGSFSLSIYISNGINILSIIICLTCYIAKMLYYRKSYRQKWQQQQQQQSIGPSSLRALPRN